jgi:transcriptional regulator with XRE-family HTH domain
LGVKKTHDEVVMWLEEQMRLQSINRAELARRGDMTQGALSNVFSGKRGVSKNLGKKIAKGLDLPQAVAFRGLGIADDDEQEITQQGERIANLLKDIDDEVEQDRAVGLVELILRQIAEQVRSRRPQDQNRGQNRLTNKSR